MIKPSDQDSHCFDVASESTVSNEITQLNSLKTRSECAILIYSAGQGLSENFGKSLISAKISLTGLFLAHLSHWLMVSYCDRWMPVVRCEACFVRHKQLLQRTSPPKLLAGFLPNLAGMILIWPSLIIVQMVLVCCISRSHRLKIDFRDKTLKIFLSETTRPRWPHPSGYMFYIGLLRDI